MSLLNSRLIFSVSKRCFGTTHANLAFWNKDWKPAKYPTTEEEKVAAAKKYNLLREEYEPIPDDGNGAGDYPHFKPYSVESRDPFYPWDYPEYRRNFNEAMHEDMHLYGEDRFDVLLQQRYSTGTKLGTFFGFMGFLYLITYIFQDTCFLPIMPQALPKPGVTNYKYS